MKPSDKTPNEANYHKAHDIVNELLDTYERGDSVNDNERISDYLKENSRSAKLIANLSSDEVHREFSQVTNNADRERNRQAFLTRLDRTKPRRRLGRRLAIATGTVAAAVILAILLLRPSFESEGVYIYKNLVSEEVSLPTLILDNDEALTLDDTMLDFIGHDYSVEYSSGNYLAYTSTADDATLLYNKLIIPKQFTHTVRFGDGTEVVVNAGSTLRYPVNFTGDNREVELSGEAFFRVAKSEKPFYVKTGRGTVAVYGTEFNINTHSQDRIEVVLIEGSIGFSVEGLDEVRMEPGDRLSYSDGKPIVEKVAAADYTMWTENKFYFREQPLERVLSEIAAWYGVEISAAAGLSGRRLTLIADRGMPVEEAFDFIMDIMNVKITKRGDMGYKIE